MKPVYETAMVDQPYTVCRPVTTVRQEVRECGYYERQYTTVPGPIVEQQGPRSGRATPCDSCGLFSCFHKRKVTATVAVQCPPRTVVPARLRVAARGAQRHRDPLRPRNHGAPGARDDLPLRRRGTGRERSPSPPAQYVAEERVEPYEVRTCQYVSPRSGSRRSRSPPASTSPRNASSPTRCARARWSPRSGSRSIPVTTCSVRRRGACRALRGPHLPVRFRRAG